MGCVRRRRWDADDAGAAGSAAVTHVLAVRSDVIVVHFKAIEVDGGGCEDVDTSLLPDNSRKCLGKRSL